MHSSITASSLVLALCLVPAVLGEQRSFVRRANKAHKAAASASSSGSASDAQYTTINGKQYPTDLSPNAPAPIVTTNWWLDEVQKNDTTKHSFAYDSLPKSSEDGQKGTNQCTKGQNQGSMCQTVLVNGADDFCLWAPPDKDTAIADSEEYEVAWCTKDHGARLIPQGTLSSVHFVKTDKYVQVTGTGDFTKINIKAGDQGGELDPHGATGNGNPIGGLVYTTAFSNGKKHDQILEWMSEISATDFCFRGCKGTDADAQMQCTHIYDEMGCGFIMPANYTENIFEECSGEAAPPPGIIGTWTFTQGDPVTPSPRPAPSSSDCSNIASPTGPSFTGPAASPSASSSAAAGPATGAAAAAGKAASTLPSLGQKAAATGSSSGAQGQQNANSRSTVTSGAYTTAVSLITVAGVVMVSTGAFVLL